MKKAKTIICLLGDSGVGKTTAANIMSSKGFFKAHIRSKVMDIAKHIFSKQELQSGQNEIINQIHDRGCKVCNEYWVNLALITVADNVDFVVFDDISLKEASNNKFKLYQIVRKNHSTNIIPNVEIIENNGTLKEFTAKIEDIVKKISKYH